MPTKVKLIVPKDRFSKELENRIKEGKILLAKEIPSVSQLYYSRYGYNARTAMQPMQLTDAENAFIAEFGKWTDYNSEMFKQYFDVTNNEYYTKYHSCGCASVITVDDDIVQLYKDELRAKINYLDSFKGKLELLSCSLEEHRNEQKNEKQPLLFISHSSADEGIASALVTMLRTLGFNKQNLFCSSVPGYDIAEGEDIYDNLATKFTEYDIYVIFLLSKNYYDSVACLNEMGATWVLKTKYSTIICPGFDVPDIKGAINPRKMAVMLGDSKRVNGKLNQLKDHLIEFFHLPEVEDDTIWENDRNEFLKSIEKKD